MEQQRKIKCDCGHILVEQKALFDHFEVEAMVCPHCNFITLTKEQAKKYADLQRLHDVICSERKIIRIGNSMGLILPDKLQEFGIKIGKKIRTEAIDEKSFKVIFAH